MADSPKYGPLEARGPPALLQWRHCLWECRAIFWCCVKSSPFNFWWLILQHSVYNRYGYWTKYSYEINFYTQKRTLEKKLETYRKENVHLTSFTVKCGVTQTQHQHRMFSTISLNDCPHFGDYKTRLAKDVGALVAPTNSTRNNCLFPYSEKQNLSLCTCTGVSKGSSDVVDVPEHKTWLSFPGIQIS